MTPPVEGFAARIVLGPALRAQPDRRLVKLVREGYETAFEEIVRRYGKPLTRYAGAIVGGRAEDVTQDAFSKALLALRRDGAEIELRPWLFRIVRNTALNELRDSPPTPEALAEAIATGGSPAEELERREELADLMRHLQSLPEAQRAAIVMRELEGLSHEEIAAALGLSGGAARQAIYRARRALRDGMGMLLPMPLLKALLAGTATAPVEAAAGVGGTAAVGVGLKAAAATVLVAGAVGAGVAVHDGQRGRPHAEAQPEQALAEDSGEGLAAGSSRDAGGSPGGSDPDRSGRGRGGEAESGDHRGNRSGSDEGGGSHDGSAPSSGPGSGDGSDGTRHGDRDGQGGGSADDHGGSSGLTGDGDRHSGDSGHSPGGSSGPGGDELSGDGDAQPPTESLESDSGPGAGGGEDGGDRSGEGGGGSGDGGSGAVDLGGSGDSHDGNGFSMQTEPQP